MPETKTTNNFGNTSNNNSQEFEKNLDHVKDLAQDSVQTLEQLIESGRHLATEYVGSKRGDAEKYIDEIVNISQDKLVKAIDSTMSQLSGIVKRYSTEFGDSIQSGLKRIDARPALPLVAGFIGGCLLGMFLGSRTNMSRIKDTVRSKTESFKKVA